MNKMKLGIIGCGDIAVYMSLFASLNRRIKMTACCDVNREKAERFVRWYRTPQVFTDYQELLARAELDAVYLAVPHVLHAEMIRAAADANVHVLVEKPIACTVQQAKQVIALTAEKGIKIGVNYQYRYDTGCYALARALQADALGKITYARVNIPWRREVEYFAKSAWHASKEQAGGGTLITQGSHLVDILLWAIGSQPVAANGKTAQQKFKQVEVEDLALGMVELENGALLQITSSMIAVPEQPILLEVYGERGTAIYTNRPKPRVRFLGVRVQQEKPPFRGADALQCSLEGFRLWVMEGIPYLTPIETALPALATVEAIYRSAHSGHWEPVEL